MRQLASIKRILSIRDIPGKDRIGLATVDGWSVIVQKSEFKEGDLCVYIEIDSLLPKREEFAFMEKTNYRVKTMKMAGCISQGICFPMSILPKGNYKEEDDVTDILGITKWERPDATDVSQSTNKKCKKTYPKFLMRSRLFRWILNKIGRRREARGFPDFVSKTDETRIQNCPFYLGSDKYWVVTEKIDGQSGTFALKRTRRFGIAKDEFYVCSRNVRLWKEDSSSYWYVWNKYRIDEVLRCLADMLDLEWIAIQGECIAPNVQGNKYKVEEPDLYVFNLITSGSGRWSSQAACNAIESFGMKFVPIIGVMQLPKTVDEMLELAHGDSVLGNTIREGLVCRSLDGNVSFKAVDPLFLLEYDE